MSLSTVPGLARRSLLAALALLVATPFGRGTAAEGTRECPTRDCGWVYDPAIGDPEHGIAPGTPFEALPEDWTCPACERAKDRW